MLDRNQMVLEALREVLQSDYRGPRAVFTQVDVLKTIIAIGRSGKVGRGRLGLLTGLGQGEVRTLIKRLKENGLINIETNGCVLSRRGEEEYSKIRSLMLWSFPVEAQSLGLGKNCWAVGVAGAARKVHHGIEQRDAAIRSGADGAFTAILRTGRFTVPGEGTDCEKDGPKEPWISIRKAGLSDGDAVIVTGSAAPAASENGAMAALMTLL